MKKILLILILLPLLSFSQSEKKVNADLERYRCIKNEGAFKGHGIFSRTKSLISFYKASKRARKYAAELYPNIGGTNTKRDAYRHIIWSSLLAKYFGNLSSVKNRLEFAEAVGNANEVCGANKKDGSQMDYHNNEVGRNLFVKNSLKRKFLNSIIGCREPKTSDLKRIAYEIVEKANFIDRKIGEQQTLETIKSLEKLKPVFIKK